MTSPEKTFGQWSRSDRTDAYPQKDLLLPGSRALLVRPLAPADTEQVVALLERNPPLRPHGLYVYKVLAHLFADTCYVAEVHGAVRGLLCTLLPRNPPDVLFVWYLCMDRDQESIPYVPLSLIRQMLHIARRNSCTRVQFTLYDDDPQSKRLLKIANNFFGHYVSKRPFCQAQEGGRFVSETLYEFKL